MTRKRLFQTIRLWLTPSSSKRTKYYKKKKIFRNLGHGCSIMDRKVPLYSNLISIGNNVHLASHVDFITHDIAHIMLNNIKGSNEFLEKIGCINIEDNVFVGSNSKILYGVNIGSNVIVAAGSIVTKDIPSNSIVAGVPARVIGSFEQFLEKRKKVIIQTNLSQKNKLYLMN